MIHINVIDWQYLKKALILLMLSVFTGVLLVAVTEIFVQNKRAVNNTSQASLNQMNARYRDAINQLQLIEDYLPAYESLVEQGFVGAEDRLQWVETLQVIAKQRKLASIDYDIRPIRPYVPGQGFNAQQFQMYVSEMTLKMNLRREKDLLQVFTDIDQQLAGKNLIRQCRLQRMDAGAARVSGRRGLVAECTLGVFTIRPRS